MARGASQELTHSQPGTALTGRLQVVLPFACDPPPPTFYGIHGADYYGNRHDYKLLVHCFAPTGGSSQAE